MGTEPATERMKPPPPIDELLMGSVKAAIWANETESGRRFKVTFSRIYQKDGEWQSTTAYGPEDLLYLAKLADQCHSWILNAAKTRTRPSADDSSASDLASASLPKARRSSRSK